MRILKSTVNLASSLKMQGSDEGSILRQILYSFKPENDSTEHDIEVIIVFFVELFVVDSVQEGSYFCVFMRTTCSKNCLYKNKFK